MPSCRRLIGAEKFLTGEIVSESVLKRAPAKLHSKWDCTLFDCSLTPDLPSLNAPVVAKEVLIPVETGVMAPEGFVRLTETVEKIQERVNPELKIAGRFPCRVDKRTRLSVDVIDRLKQ